MIVLWVLWLVDLIIGFMDGYYISSERLVFMTGCHGGCSDPGGSVGY